jgi:hypothetical protein
MRWPSFQSSSGVVRTRLMEVLVRKADGWWIEAYHNVDTKAGQ